jgi:hypothetical protein
VNTSEIVDMMISPAWCAGLHKVELAKTKNARDRHPLLGGSDAGVSSGMAS